MLVEWDKAVTDLSKNDNIIAKIIADYPKERMEMKNDTYFHEMWLRGLQ